MTDSTTRGEEDVSDRIRIMDRREEDQKTIRRLEAERDRYRKALERLVSAAHVVTVFVKTRERIKEPEGHECWGEEIDAAGRALNEETA